MMQPSTSSTSGGVNAQEIPSTKATSLGETQPKETSEAAGVAAVSSAGDSPVEPSDEAGERGFGPAPGSTAEFGMVKLLDPALPEASNVGHGKNRQPGIVHFGVISTGWGLPGEVVARVLRQHWSKMRACYERSLAKNEKLEGRVELEFSIDSKGVVVSPRIGNSNLNDPKMVSCLLKDLVQLAFPVPAVAPVLVSLPIRFKRGVGQNLSEHPSTDK